MLIGRQHRWKRCRGLKTAESSNLSPSSMSKALRKRRRSTCPYLQRMSYHTIRPGQYYIDGGSSPQWIILIHKVIIPREGIRKKEIFYSIFSTPFSSTYKSSSGDSSFSLSENDDRDFIRDSKGISKAQAEEEKKKWETPIFVTFNPLQTVTLKYTTSA